MTTMIMLNKSALRANIEHRGVLKQCNVQVTSLKQADLEPNTRIAAIENSTFWKMTFTLRRALGSDQVLVKIVRRMAKLVWWTITFRLGSKLRESRRRNAGHYGKSHLALPNDDYCLAVPFGYSVSKWESVPQLAVICHMFYIEMLDEFHRYFFNIPFPFDLFITTDSQEKKSRIDNRFSRWEKGKIEVRIVPNRGRDIAPTLITCRDVCGNYEFFLHVHTKKSPHHPLLRGWRSYLLETLLGSEQIVESIFESFKVDPKLGMIAPQHFAAVRPAIGWGWNFKSAQKLARRMGVNISPDGRMDFPSGSMFWARSAALKPLLDCNLSLDEFPSEPSQLDGTMGHVIERLFFFSCERAGYRWIKILQPSLPGSTQRVRWAEGQNELSSFIENYQYDLLRQPQGTELRVPSVVAGENSPRYQL